jgi:hypothetical protein
MALVGLDLADVVRHRRGADDVADPLAGLSAAPVEVERVVPATLVVGVDAEVVQHLCLPEQVAQLLVDRQREAAEGDSLGAAELGVGDVQQVVRVREAGQVLDCGGVVDDPAAPLDAVAEHALAGAGRRRGKPELDPIDGPLLAFRQRLDGLQGARIPAEGRSVAGRCARG